MIKLPIKLKRGGDAVLNGKKAPHLRPNLPQGKDSKIVKTIKKGPHLPRQHADLSYLKSCNSCSTIPNPGIDSGKIIGRSSGSRIILQASSRSFDQWHTAFCHRLQRRVRGGI